MPKAKRISDAYFTNNLYFIGCKNNVNQTLQIGMMLALLLLNLNTLTKLLCASTKSKVEKQLVRLLSTDYLGEIYGLIC